MNSLLDQFDRQKQYFASGVTRSYTWRIKQLDRVARLVGENEAALQDAIAQDFKTGAREDLVAQHVGNLARAIGARLATRQWYRCSHAVTLSTFARLPWPAEYDRTGK